MTEEVMTTDEVVDRVEETIEAGAPPAPTSIEEIKPKMKVTGKVQRLELYGAILDIGVGVPAILHISQLGKERVNRVADVLNVGDEVTVWVDKVDTERNQVTATMIQPLAVEWSDLKEGQVYSGVISRLENFGAFVDIGAEKEGLVHISELSHEFVKQPSEVVKPGDEVQVRVLGFSKRKRRIDLSMKALMEAPQPTAAAPAAPQQQSYEPYDEEEDVEGEMPTAMAVALQQAFSDAGVKFDHRRRQPQGKKGRGQRNRSQQDDILSRTLRINQRNGGE
jgi:small subunit ribosomal protein S1